MKNFFAIGLVLVLVGCGWNPLTKTVIVETMVFPEMPPVPLVSKLQLLPCPIDRPRVYWEPKVIKSDSTCKNRLKEDPTLSTKDKFIGECMEYRIDVNSNIKYGYDKAGQQCFLVNREKIRAKLKQYQDRIRTIDLQREEWKSRNKTEKK